MQATFGPGTFGAFRAPLAWCVLAMFSAGQLVHFAIVTAPMQTHYGSDFSAYYLAGKVVEERPAQTLYDLPLLADGRMNLHTEDSVGSKWDGAARRYHVPYKFPFIYPPFFAVLMIPFVHLSFAGALVAWNAMTVLLVAGAVLLSFSTAGVRMDGRLALITGVGLFSFYPFLLNLSCGQMGGVLLFLFAGGVWLLSRNQVWLSAFCFALATLIKLTPALVVPLLVIHRRWRWLVAYGIWIVVMAGISIGVTGWAAYAEFWHSALPAMACGSAVWENTSLMSWVQQMFLGYTPQATAPAQMIPAYACKVSKLASLVVYGAFLLLCWIRRKEQNLERWLVAMALLGIATSPISWWHHYTLALLPLIYLWCTMREGMGRRCLAALGIVVGTNVIGIIGLIWQGNVMLPALAAVTPILTVAVAFAAVAGKQEIARPC
ncbi:MAG TPA: glycosyltransferase family 87 protein [Acidobacteriaceae bacterium]